MCDNLDFETRAAKYLEELREKESEKRMLYDREIGGDLAPRPSLDFIEKCIGPMKSEEALHEEAHNTAATEITRSRSEMLRKAEVEQSFRDQNRQIQDQQDLLNYGGKVKR